MCGIVGYVGPKEAAPLLLEALHKLEYRGYDSSGICVAANGSIQVAKARGRLQVLRDMTQEGAQLPGHIGVGHTRWATHGEPSDVNSHPHLSQGGRVALVHNGIVENYMELREFLSEKGYTFASQTDTEIAAQLIDHCYHGDPVQAVREAVNLLTGSFALGILFKDHPDQIIAVRKDSPLIVGLGKGENFIASDIPALLKHTRDIVRLDEYELAVIRRDRVQVFDRYGDPVEKPVQHVDWDPGAAEKGGYEHFMFKEIMEQPAAFAATLSPRIRDGKIVLDGVELTEEYVRGLERIHIVACGTAYHCGLVGKYFIEKLMRLPVNVELSSEFRYSDPILDKSDLVIVISQSGETMDTIAAMREAQNKGCKVLAICNVVGSTISREADFTAYTWAGPEIAVASTKAYVSQLIMTYVIALDIAFKRGALNKEKADAYLKELCRMPEKLEEILKGKEEIKRFAQAFRDQESVFYLGRRLDYYIAQEASLKLKEITYIHSEALAAGELKHGTLALIEDGTLVITLATQKALMEKTISNITECRVRGAKVLSITFNDEPALKKESDYVWTVPETLPEFAPVLAILPMQLFAYYVACAKGCDVDKPRNLAKSVTVE